jgi:hypothetical protein
MSNHSTFDLFKISFDNEDEDVLSFKKILDSPLEKYSKIAKNGNKIDLDGLIKKDGELYFGIFCLLQTTELPPKAKFGKEPTEILSEDDEDTGLGHYTLFIFDPTNEVIIIQRNRNGVSYNGIAYFFQRNYNVRNFEFEILINPAELKQLSKLSVINTFEFSIAKPESSTAFFDNTDSKSMKQIMRVADDTNANVLKIQFGIGYERSSSLKKSSIIDIARSLLKNKKEDLQKIEIRGRETDESGIEMVDLINNRAKIIVPTPKVRSITRVYLVKIIKKAIEEYRKIKPDLDKVYKVKRKPN